MQCTEVAVLRGGPSSEYEVSLQTGAGVLASLKHQGIATKDIIISRKGEWMVGGFVRSPKEALSGVDVAFIALHGMYGEDGTVQRILERYGIPYTGSGPYASAVAMNKALTKEHLKPHGLKMAQHIKLSREGTADVRQAANNIAHLFGPEYVVKPVSGGSSMHTIMAHSHAELVTALESVLPQVDAVLVEERIVGREATVAVLEKYRGDTHYVLPPIEIVPPSHVDFFDTAAKYSGATDEICPGRFSAAERDELLATARAVHTILNLRHYSRSDFMINKEGIYFLEVNTLPGLTAQSLFPKAIEAVGGTYNELVGHLLTLATTR